MPEIYFISDTHFSHENFLKFKDDEGNLIRPFNSIEEHDEYMIQKWNSVVREGDRVYHLGDVTMDYNKFKTIAPRLKGSKRLIVGNHDDIPQMVKGGWFKKVQLWRLFKDEGFTCSHIPLREDQMRHYITLNVHGHTHQHKIGSGYMNVCVENNDYTPWHMDQIKAVVAIKRYQNNWMG